jgi:hypothetical protein
MSKPSRLEFGNPEHIKLAAVGYAIGEAIEKDLTAELIVDSEGCAECGGHGWIETFECGNCEYSSDDQDDVVYSEWHVKHLKADPGLIGRCTRCHTKLFKEN